MGSPRTWRGKPIDSRDGFRPLGRLQPILQITPGGGRLRTTRPRTTIRHACAGPRWSRRYSGCRCDLRQAFVLDLRHINRGIPGRPHGRRPDRALNLRRQRVHVVAEQRAVVGIDVEVELAARRAKFLLNGYADNRALFPYDMHTLPSEVEARSDVDRVGGLERRGLCVAGRGRTYLAQVPKRAALCATGPPRVCASMAGL